MALFSLSNAQNHPPYPFCCSKFVDKELTPRYFEVLHPSNTIHIFTASFYLKLNFGIKMRFKYCHNYKVMTVKDRKSLIHVWNVVRNFLAALLYMITFLLRMKRKNQESVKIVEFWVIWLIVILAKNVIKSTILKKLVKPSILKYVIVSQSNENCLQI